MKLVPCLKLLSFGILLNFTFCQATQAQIVPDNSLRDNSVVTPDGEIIQIEGGTKRGENLFHSFEEFSVPTNNTASFNNAADVQNIFSRVTGSSRSEIDGILQTQGTADLFLINPNGIIFGENAALNVGGSFLATTAQSVRFEDGTQFNTTGEQNTPLLTVTAPIGLGLGANPGTIINRSLAADFLGEFAAGLQVQPGNTIALLGGEIVLDGGALTVDEGGRIELGGVAQNNFVNLIQDERGWKLNYEGVASFEDISLSQLAIVSSFGDIGDISIYGKNISLIEDSQISLNTFLSEAGNLVVKASESITIEGSRSGLFNEVRETGTGEGAELSVETEKLFILGGTISNATYGEGNGSNLILKTKELILEDGGQILGSTFGEGDAGNLTVVASDSIFLQGRNSEDKPSAILAQVEPGGTGNGNNLSIETSQLTILDGAQISTAARNNGRGGDIDINVSNSILLSGTLPLGNVETSRSGIITSTQPEATADSGNLQLSTGLLTIEKGAILAADNRGTGNAGNVEINVDRAIVRDGGQISAGSLVNNDALDNIRGSGGNLTINASDSIEVVGTGTIRDEEVNSTIFTKSQGTGDSGNLNIFTPNLTVADSGNIDVGATGTGEAGSLSINASDIVLDRGSLTAETKAGDEGNISLNNADILLLRNNSQITTNAIESATGGDIAISSDGIALLDSSSITANAVRGQGGNIQITTQGIFQEPDSEITAASELGIDGTVTFNTPDVDPTSGILELPDVPLDAENILAQDLCKLEDEKIAKGSSFVITGKGGLTPTSSSSLSNRDRLVDWASREDIDASDDGTVGIRQREEQATVNKSYPDIQQSQGLLVAADGSTWLTADAPESTQIAQMSHPDCKDGQSPKTK